MSEELVVLEGTIAENGIVTMEDGDYVVTEDGEIVALKNDEFHVDSVDAAEWVFEKMAGHDAEVLALEAREKAIVENMKRQKAAHERRRAFLEYRFGKELEYFARQQLAGGKSKTWSCPWGKVSFRKTNGSCKIVDMEAAVALAKENGLADKVRVKEDVLASDFKDWVLANEPENGVVFEWAGPGESVKIDTGVKK